MPPASDSLSPLIAAALAQLAEGVIVVNEKGRIIFVNAAAAALHGVAKLDVPIEEYATEYHLFTDAGDPFSAAELPLARAARDGEHVVDARWRVRPPHGGEIRAIGSARPVLDTEGRQIGAVLTVRDDGARQAEAATRLERDVLAGQLREAFEQSPLSTVVYDATGRPIAANPAFERLWGAGLNDVPAGYSVLEDPQLQAAGVIPQLRRVFGLDGAGDADGAGETLTLPPLRYDVASTTGRGQALWTQAHLYPVRRPDGAVDRVVLMHLDVTEERRAAEALREAAGTLELRNEQLRSQAVELEMSNQQLQEQALELESHAEALQASQDQLRTLADAIPTLAWTARADGFIDWYNARWYEYTGTTPADMEGWGWQSVHDPELLPQVMGRWQASIATGEPFEMTFPLRGADGKFRQFLTRVSPVTDVADQVIRWFGTNTDVDAERAARITAERAVQRVERLNTLTAALAGARTVTDVAEVLVAQAAAATGAGRGALLLRPPGSDEVVMVQHVGVSDAIAEKFTRFPLSRNSPTAECIRTGVPVFVETREGPEGLYARFPEMRQPFDDLGSHAIATVPLRAAGDVVGAMSFSFDAPRSFTDEDRGFFLALGHQAAQAVERARLFEAESAAHAAAEEARAMAEAANKAKTEFLTTMSHELRTPLNAIGGYAELVELGIHGPVTDQQQEALSRIRRSQQHLLGLINDVLNFAKIEAGHVEYDIVNVDASAAIDALEPLVAPQLRAKSILFGRQACQGDACLRADPDKLQQILANLLSNAIKFTRAGGSVTLRCEVRPDTVSIAVTDTGIGIAADRLEHIFSPFVQIGRRLNAPGEGAGLGLAISRDLARSMDGTLTVESVPGVGSTFTVTLPRGS